MAGQLPRWGGYLSASQTFPLVYEGKPALLMVGWTYNGRDAYTPRIHYQLQVPPLYPARLTPAFTLRAVLVMDSRSCARMAPGMRVAVINDDFSYRIGGYGELGRLPTHGVFEWYRSRPLAYLKDYTDVPPQKVFTMSYCDFGWGSNPCGACHPEVSAWIVTI